MRHHLTEIVRFGLNGFVATAVHFGVLTYNFEVLALPSAGLSNFLAAIFGITVSFIGSRYFVFRKTDEAILKQAMRFSGLYGAIAMMHGVFLLIWTDWMVLDYRIGFLLATGVQVVLSYTGNKWLVFKA